MMQPNFFIVGAQKCGTTALSEYLRMHPAVFFSDPKEPHYFAEDMPGLRYARSLDAYLSLFRGASDKHAAVGEGSVGYLYSDVALQRMVGFAPDAKLIAMVRNPVDLVISMHRQFLYSRWEDNPDLERAWELQDVRAHGEFVPSGCRVPAFLQYRRAALLGEQVVRMLELFPKHQVWVGVFDDLVEKPRETYLSILSFLGLDDDGRTAFPVINESKTYRSALLAGMSNRLKPFVLPSVIKLKAIAGIDLMPWLRRVESTNMQGQPKSQLSQEMYRRLACAFVDDVKLLSDVLGRDLTHWVRCNRV